MPNKRVDTNSLPLRVDVTFFTYTLNRCCGMALPVGCGSLLTLVHKMKTFLQATLGAIVLMTSSCSRETSSKPGNWHFTYKEVRAFRLNWENEQSFARILDGDGNLNPTRIPQDGLVLTNEQITTLEAAVTGGHPDHPIADCFYPHHAFIFYGESGEIVGHIDICFLCSNYSGEPQGYAGNWNLVALRELFSDIGIPLSNKDWD